MLGIFLDLETTGLNYKYHRTIEIAFQIIDLQTKKILDEYSQIIFQPPEVWKRSNPESLRINGFSWEDISLGKKEGEVKNEIITYFKKHKIARGHALFICQNPSFDRIFFSQIIDPDLQEQAKWPYHWLDLASMHWGIEVLHKRKNPNETAVTKNQIARFYKMKEEPSPHRALQGVKHLVACYQAMNL